MRALTSNLPRGWCRRHDLRPPVDRERPPRAVGPDTLTKVPW